MLEIRKALMRNILPDGIDVKLRYKQAKKSDKFPYVVFDYDFISSQNESFDKFVLEIDGWDYVKNGSTVRLERLMEQIDGNGDIENPTGLNRKTIDTDGVIMQLDRDSRMTIPDSKEGIQHIRYTYSVTVFERRN